MRARQLEIFDSEEYLFLVMELTTGGELFDRIVAKGCYTEEEASQLVRKIVLAIKVIAVAVTRVSCVLCC